MYTQGIGLGILICLARDVYAAQPSAPSPLPAPLRKLPWGQLNFLHTTDTHGWHAGHLLESQYSADWGDYISFAQHLRDRADADGSDLLVVDTGDRVEGNGLYDASDPKGEYTFAIFTQQHMDIITTGNHELYLANSSNNEYHTTVPAYKNSYLASNLDIFDPETGKQVAMAPRFRKFTTKNQGIRIIAFGFLFDFRGNANNTVVIPVEETIKTKWFQDAIRDRDVDLFVVAGHVPVHDSPEYTAVYKAIRSVQWDTPIQFFGGHTHIRDYAIYDKAAVALESGRYMETIGFQSISGLSTSKSTASKNKLTFERLYIDNNRYSLESHAGVKSSDFLTKHGANVSKQITAARTALNLDSAYGCAPRTLWLSRAPYPSNDSLLTWLDKKVLPWLAANVSSSPSIVLTNTGAMRFDIFQGQFTIDSTFLLSPFTSGVRRMRDIPYAKANKILGLLNNQGKILLEQADANILAAQINVDPSVAKRKMLHRLTPPLPPVRRVPPAEGKIWQPAPAEQHPLALSEETYKDLTPGYTTVDDHSSVSPGDDTLHAPIKFYDSPPAVGSEVGVDPAAPPETIDLIFNEFIEPWIVLALKFLGETDVATPGEQLAGGRTLTSFLADWIAEHWPCSS